MTDLRDSKYYDEQTFAGLRQPEITLSEAQFYNCTFTDCVLRESTFECCDFFDCVFDDCDLSLLKVPGCTFTQATFKHCKLLGVNWSEIDQEGKFLKPFDFHECELNYSTFIGMKLKEVAFNGCNAHDTDFAEADMTGCDCRETAFPEARFLHTNLSKANFTKATAYRIVLEHNTLKGAIFSLPEAVALLRDMGIIIADDD